MDKAPKIEFDDLFITQKLAFDTLKRACLQVTQLSEANKTAPIVATRLNRVEQCWNECTVNHREMFHQAYVAQRGNHEYFNSQAYIKAKELYVNARDVGATLLQQLEQVPLNHRLSPAAPFVSTSNVQLQKIGVPKFDGNIINWKSYQDAFCALVKDNNKLSNIEKFHYLKMSIDGEASELISTLDMTNENWPIAWEMLEKRYSKKRLAVNAYLTKICNASHVKKENYKELLTLRNNFHSAVEAIKSLISSDKQFDVIIVYMLSECLNYSVKKDWELSMAQSTELATYKQLDEFLLNRIKALESLNSISHEKSNETNENKFKAKDFESKKVANSKTKNFTSYLVTEPSSACGVCSGDHKMYMCEKFKKMPVNERIDCVRSFKLCLNCLGKNHVVRECKSNLNCRKYNKRHNTLLHRENKSNQTEKSESAEATGGSEDTGRKNEVVSNHLAAPNMRVLLATATVWIAFEKGHLVQVRALIDPGSTYSFISKKAFSALGVRGSALSAPITGLGGVSVGSVSRSVEISLLNESKAIVHQVHALVIPTITAYSASSAVDLSSYAHLCDLKLADDLKNCTEIHMLFGADTFGAILKGEVRRGKVDEPIAQNTIFGWVVLGPYKSCRSDRSLESCFVHHVNVDLETHYFLKKFWELEQVSSKIIESPDNEFCENHFQSTQSRNDDGRYIVRIPFVAGKLKQLGNSRGIAESNLRRIENSFKQKQEVWNQYRDFMQEYRSMGHMSVLSDATSGQKVYLPHHPVIRETSQTTKLRVVFNASCKTSSGVSLNDCMHSGPALQSDLSVVFSQWRSYPYVFISDIAKMYRQTLIDEADRKYQCILWRDSPNETLREYTLNTVTYRTRSAPFLALRVVKQLTMDEGYRYKKASEILNKDTFVDDILFSAYSKADAIEARNEVIELLSKGKLEPRKWASNSFNLIKDISSTNHGLALGDKGDDKSDIKVLGVHWSPDTDSISFSVNVSVSLRYTKRIVLSTLVKLYDPLGWISPVIVQGKILMHQL